LSTEESWERTPREFAALERVYETSMGRWAMERADFWNASFKHPKGDKARWMPDDFFDTPAGRLRKAQHQKDLMELKAAQREEKRQVQLMKAGQFDESELPVWARMTLEEKAARQ
jgi:hypothetical protein